MLCMLFGVAYNEDNGLKVYGLILLTATRGLSKTY
jgi:hypothetical protein